MANDAQSRKKPGNRPKKTIRSIDKMPESEPSQVCSCFDLDLRGSSANSER